MSENTKTPAAAKQVLNGLPEVEKRPIEATPPPLKQGHEILNGKPVVDRKPIDIPPVLPPGKVQING